MTKEQLKDLSKTNSINKEAAFDFIKHVLRVFTYEVPDADNDYSRGYRDGIKQVESEIFEDEK
jgi:hypothetical protein